MAQRGSLASLFAVAAITLHACAAGDGRYLDERGRPLAHPYAQAIGSKFGSASFAPTYSEIVTVFFEQFCTECHAGASPSKGLDLSEETAYDALVGVSSLQRSGVNRVQPGDPDNSYLVIKLEGGGGMAGRQMPRGKPARPQEEIDTIRAWIADGAPRN